MGLECCRLSPLNPPNLKRETVFKSAGGSIYRIPALFHMKGSTTLLAFAEMRKNEKDHSATGLYMKTGTVKEERSDVKTIEWSEIKLLKEARLSGYRSMNPCPVYEKTTKKLFLFFICVFDAVSEWDQINTGHNQTRLCYVTSEDLGQTWSEVTDLTDKLSEIKEWATFAVGPGHGLQTESGRLIIPVYAYKCTESISHALCLYSDDSGEQWHFGKMLEKQSNECQMAEFFDKDKSFIYCNARTTGEKKKREEAVSETNGQRFSRLKGKLPETGNGCQGSVVSFPAQGEAANTTADLSQNPNKWLLYTHPTHQSKRKALGVYLNKSPQNPNAWSKPWIINEGPSGYSDLAYIGDGWFACLVECGEFQETEQIASVIFHYKQVKQAIGE